VGVRFILFIVGAALIAVLGLFIYGQMLEPETRVIEQDAIDGSGADA
jgi:hypothetical protein